MRHARQHLFLLVVASIVAPALEARSSPPTQAASAVTSAPDLSIQRTLIADSNAARAAGDYASARAMAAEVVTNLLARPQAERSTEWLALLELAGLAAHYAQDSRTASSAWKTVYEVRLVSLSDEHPDLQRARLNFGESRRAVGDFSGARSLFEKVVEIDSRTLSADHPDLQRARQNLAATMHALGDLAGARALEEQVLEVQSRTLPDDHPDLQFARQNLAMTIKALGDLAGARALEEKVLEVRSRTLPDDHPELQRVRQTLAATLYFLGDLTAARLLFEKVLEARSRTLPDEHPDMQSARQSLASVLYMQGDLSGARALEEKALAVNSRTLPDDHPDLQRARLNLAVTLHMLGDLAGARALEEKVLEVRSRVLPDEHPDLQRARRTLAVTLHMLGDVASARTLQEKVLDVDSRTLPDEHPDLQAARKNLALTIKALGDFADARALEEKVLAVESRTLPDDNPDLQQDRQNLAVTLMLELARERHSRGVEGEATGETDEGRARCVELIDAVCRSQVHAARAAILASPGREAEERCSSMAPRLDAVVSFALGYGVFESLRELDSPAFEFAETTRGAALASATFTRRASHTPKYGALRVALRDASDALARLAQTGTTSDEFDRARVKRESVERELVALEHEAPGGKEGGAAFDVESLRRRLAAGEAAVGFRRFLRRSVQVVAEPDSTGRPAVRETFVESLCAFVVRSSSDEDVSRAPSALTLVDLGVFAPIEAAVRGWRAAIGVGLERGTSVADAEIDHRNERGHELRRLVFDPLLPAIGAADRIVVVPDEVLHLVPLEALPLADSKALVGDRWRIETRSTLTELVADSPAPTGTALIALGGASFNSAPVGLSVHEVASVEEPAPENAEPTHVAAVLRGTAWERGFAPLTHSGDEARGIGALYAEIHEDDPPALVLEKRKASRAALIELAPKARFLHIATHGWFAPESIQSWSDPEPIDKQSGLGMRMSGEEQVKGMSPMLLCGLALAGANLPETATGRAPGLVTADELSTLDLSNCELAVVSACDTNVGERRAGQGVASLQKALQMAGARSVITSLWKVPDEATKELMLDFYRRLWVEKKPKHQALWEAKTKLREAKDERGAPKYTTRDWAAWVLTGNPE